MYAIWRFFEFQKEGEIPRPMLEEKPLRQDLLEALKKLNSRNNCSLPEDDELTAIIQKTAGCQRHRKCDCLHCYANLYYMWRTKKMVIN